MPGPAKSNAPTAWMRLIIQAVAVLGTGTGAVYKLENDLSNVQVTVNAVQVDVGGLKAQVADAQGSIHNLDRRVDGLTNDLLGKGR